ncbi:ATP-binding protein [Pseudonocardia acaciae]|uniref:ATP-binding protein n=1 Tax=Pseudonocardia acaciae TaxID=551276 RepID=UPI00068862AD|nr:ATP-binding protein [Pseudonocardia acaciae]
MSSLQTEPQIEIRTGPVEFVHRAWPAAASELSGIRREVYAWLATFRLDDDEKDDLVLAVDEATANAVEHAYDPDEHGTVELLLWTEPHVLYIEVVDHGRWKPPSDATSYRGRGMQVMRSITDSVLIHYDGRGTRVLLRRRLPRHRKQRP